MIGENSGKTLRPEWSHCIDVDSVSLTPQKVQIVASARELRDLATRLSVVSIDSLEANLVLSREKKTIVIHIKGSFKAKVVQECIVTSLPVYSLVEESFDTWFSDSDQAVPFARVRQQRQAYIKGNEIQVTDERDDPEPVVDGVIDVAELVVQHFSLALDPYPRDEQANQEIKDKGSCAVMPDNPNNPFAALKDLKSQISRQDKKEDK